MARKENRASNKDGGTKDKDKADSVKPEAAPKPGERRTVRTMVWMNQAGVKQSYTAIFTDRNDITLINQVGTMIFRLLAPYGYRYLLSCVEIMAKLVENTHLAHCT